MPKPHDNVIDLNSRRQSKEQILERLFKEHGSALRAFLAGRTRNQAEADDLLQEVFVRLARIDNLVERLEGKRGNVRSFIYTTANNLAMDVERRKAVRRHYQDTESSRVGELTYEITPEVVVTATQELEVIKRAILALPANWRKAFTMSRFKHMSYKQIADEMGLSVKVIEKYINRALIELRKVVEAAHGQEGGE